MELTNEKVINAPRTRVYDTLHDAQILRQVIPGCQALSKVAPDQYEMTVALKVGPIKTTFSGTITVYNEDAPAGYSMRGQGHGSAGSAEGHAHVALAAIDATTTNLAYHVSAELAGQVSTLEDTIVETAAHTMAAEFFSRLTLLLEGEVPVMPRSAPINAPVNTPSDGPANVPVEPAIDAPLSISVEADTPVAEDFLREPATQAGATGTLERATETPVVARDDAEGPDATDVITVGGSRTDDLGVYRDTVPGARGGFDRDPHYRDKKRPADLGQQLTPIQPQEDGFARVGFATDKDQTFGQSTRGAIAQEEAGGPLRFVWRFFLITVGLIIIYLLLTDGI